MVVPLLKISFLKIITGSPSFTSYVFFHIITVLRTCINVFYILIYIGHIIHILLFHTCINIEKYDKYCNRSTNTFLGMEISWVLYHVFNMGNNWSIVRSSPLHHFHRPQRIILSFICKNKKTQASQINPVQ